MEEIRPIKFAKENDVNISAIREAVKNGNLDTIPFINYRGRPVYNIILNEKVELFLKNYRINQTKRRHKVKRNGEIRLRNGISYIDNLMGQYCIEQWDYLPLDF